MLLLDQTTAGLPCTFICHGSAERRVAGGVHRAKCHAGSGRMSKLWLGQAWARLPRASVRTGPTILNGTPGFGVTPLSTASLRAPHSSAAAPAVARRVRPPRRRCRRSRWNRCGRHPPLPRPRPAPPPGQAPAPAARRPHRHRHRLPLCREKWLRSAFGARQ
eukprot:gene22658-biopygen20761